jgi:hypothetical protein
MTKNHQTEDPSMNRLSIRARHPEADEITVTVLSLTPRTVGVDWPSKTKLFARSTGREWGSGPGWSIHPDDVRALASAPSNWKAPRPRQPMPESWNDAHGPWLPPGANVTDMPLAQLRKLGYVDEASIEKDDDGKPTWDFSEHGWDNFTDEDHRRMEDMMEARNERSSR